MIFNYLLLMLFACIKSQTTSSGFNVNMDIDIDSDTGNYMVNTASTYKFSIFTNKVSAGTQIIVTVPYQLQVLAPANSTISICKESVFFAANNSYINNTLSSCMFNEYVGYNTISFQVGSDYNGITLYYFYLGSIQNPSSVIFPDSFIVTFSGGNPTGTVSNGLVLSYIPNLIYSAGVTHLLNQSGTLDTYTFTFKITSSIPRQGQIRLTFPSPWTSAPTNILSITQIRIYGKVMSGFSVVTPITSDVVYTGLFDLAGIQVNPAMNIVITLQGVNNPNQIIVTPSFQITTLDNGSNEIDKIITGLNIAITNPGTIVVVSAYPGNQNVGSTTFIQLEFTPSAQYSPGGYIELVLPAPFVQIGPTLICSTVFGLIGLQTCSQTSFSVIYHRAISSSYQIAIILNQFVNPLGALLLPPFQLYLKEANGNIVAYNNAAFTYSTVSGTCSVVQSSRDPTIVRIGAAGATYILGFQCPDVIPTASGSILLTIPNEQMISATACQNIDSSALPCTIHQLAGMTSVSVLASDLCSSSLCPSNFLITVKLTGVVNPTFIDSPMTQSIQIFTQNLISGTTYTIDNILQGVFFTGALVPGVISAPSVSRGNGALSKTGAIDSYTFTFTTQMTTPLNSAVRITFPTGILFFRTTNLPICKIGTSSFICSVIASSTDPTQVYQILISNVCLQAAGCPSQIFTAQISGIINSFSTQAPSSSAYILETLKSTAGGLIDTCSFSYILPVLQPNVLIVKLLAPFSPVVVGEITTYQFQINNANNIIPSGANQGSLVIIFAPQTLVLQSVSCTAQTSTITLQCSASVDKNLVTVISSQDIVKGSTITITLPNNVRNAQTGGPLTPFIITSYVQGIYQIETNTAVIVVADTFNQVLNPSSTRSVATVNLPIALTLSFQTTNPIPVGAIIKFCIPTDQAVITSISSFSLKDPNNLANVLASTLNAASGNNVYQNFTLTNWCSVYNGGGSCPEQSYTSSIIISSGFKNPALAIFPSHSIRIEIYTSTGFVIDAATVNLMTIPSCNYGELVTISFTMSNQIVGQQTNLTFNFTTASSKGSLDNGKGFVSILFPVDLYFVKSSSQALTTTLQTSTSIILASNFPKYATDSQGQIYISGIIIDMMCSNSNPCTNSDLNSFTINGLYNSFTTQPKTGQIISLSTINTTSVSSPVYEIRNVKDLVIGQDIIITQQPDTIVINYVRRLVRTVDTATAIQFNISLPTRLEKGGFIQINIPTTQFVLNGNMLQYQTYSSSTNLYNSAVPLIVLSEASDYNVVLIKEWCSGVYFCPDNSNLVFMINSGFSNIGSVITTPSSFISISTLTSNSIYLVDQINNLIALQTVQAAQIQITQATLSSYQVGMTGVNLQIGIILGARVIKNSVIVLSFTQEFIRNDTLQLVCSLIVAGVETNKSCTITELILGTRIIANLAISDPCSVTCDATSVYILSVKNLLNMLSAAPFSGTLSILVSQSDSSQVAGITGPIQTILNKTNLIAGSLLQTSVTRQISIQGEASSFNLTWTTPSYLLVDAIVELSFPANQITAASQPLNIINPLFPGNNLMFTSTNNATYSIFTTSNWMCTNSPYCSAGLSFVVLVQNGANPYVKNTNSNFIISLKSTSGYDIYISSQPLVALPPLQFGIIDNMAIVHYNLPYVNSLASYLFNFTLETTQIPMGGFIRLVFPTNRVVTSGNKMACFLNSVNQLCVINFTDTVNGPNVVIANICPLQNCPAPMNFSVTVTGGLKNSLAVIPISGVFSIQTLSSDGYIVSQGIVDNSIVTPIIPQPFYSISVTRVSPQMSVISDYIITFSIVNSVPKAGFFRVIIPFDQVFVPSDGPQCKDDISMTTLPCRIVFKSLKVLWIDINSSCANGCLAGSQISIDLLGMSNPSFFSANLVTSSWQVYTMNSAKQYIDGVSTNLVAQPQLVGVTAGIMSIQLEQNNAARSTYLQVGINPGTDMTGEAIFDVYFPDQLSKISAITQCSVLIGVQVPTACSYATYPSGFISTVSIQQACPQLCTMQSTYYYNIPVQNRGDNSTVTGNWNVVVRYPLIDVGQGIPLSNPIQIQPELLTKYYVYNNGQNTVGQQSMLYISFIPTNNIPTLSNKGRIRIILPSQIRLSGSVCYVLVDNGSSSGSMCSVSGPQAIITFQTGISLIGRNITVQFSRIVNPSSTKPTDPIIIVTQQYSSTIQAYASIDYNIADITYQITTPTQLTSIQVTRMPLNNLQTGYKTGQATQLWFQLVLNHQLQSSSSISIQFPSSAQANIIPSSTTEQSCYSTDQNGRTLTMLLCEVSIETSTVFVRNYCQASSCGPNSNVYFMLMETFVQNYNFVVSPLTDKDSLIVKTTTIEGIYFIDMANTGVFITPEIQPTSMIMPSPEILRANNLVNNKVSWIFNFKTNKNAVPKGGYMTITFPQGVLLTIPDSTLDIINYDNGVRYWNVSINMFNASSPESSVQKITLWNLCNQTTGCQIGSSFSFMLDWIRNPISQITVNDSILIDMKTVEGYFVERGTTQPVSSLFSQLIPARIQNLQIRPINPLPSIITEYEIVFSADAVFSIADTLLIIFPQGYFLNGSLQNQPHRQLQQARIQQCVSLFNPSGKLKCSVIASQNAIQVFGLFVTKIGQYGVRISNITNPALIGQTGAIIIQVINSANQTTASRSTLSSVTILQAMDQTKCNQVCGSCAGTNSTCTSCKNPSYYPLYKDQKCVDACGDGYFFDQINTRCVQCDHTCQTCYGPGMRSCLNCSRGYYQQNGQCQPFCSETVIQDSNNKVCSLPYSSQCSKQCLTCSLDPKYCLSCNQTSAYPILDSSTGRCISKTTGQCASGLGNMTTNRLFMDQGNQKCQVCSELCKSCQDHPGTCTQCWNGQDKFQSRNIINDLYETCVDRCGLGTYYNQTINTCSYCNPVCLSCNGQGPDQCQVCNKTPEANQLYLLGSQCVLQCPKQYILNTLTNQCIQGQVQLLSFSFLFLFVSVFIASVLILASILITKRENKTMDITYSVTSIVEFINRLCLLGNLFAKSATTGVFPLSVCFMNIVATSSLGLFFNLLFMTPIYAHSPHFRQLWKVNNRRAYMVVEWLSYLAGVNSMRLLYSGFMGLKSLNSDLNNWKFFSVPLNMMSNYTLIFTVFQLALDIFVILFMSVSDDAFTLAAMGLALNTLMATLQLFKHLTTTRAFPLTQE